MYTISGYKAPAMPLSLMCICGEELSLFYRAQSRDLLKGAS